jgi:hypothetical protein
MAARALSPDDKARWIKVAEVWLRRAKSASESFKAKEGERDRPAESSVGNPFPMKK